jgi:hypothetical protein
MQCIEEYERLGMPPVQARERAQIPKEKAYSAPGSNVWLCKRHV